MTITAERMPDTPDGDATLTGLGVPGGLIIPGPRAGQEVGGTAVDDEAPDFEKLGQQADIASVAPEVIGTPDEQILRRLSALAMNDHAVRVMRAVEAVRVDPQRVQEWRDRALRELDIFKKFTGVETPEYNVPYRVLSAALEIPGTAMERNGVPLSESARRRLARSILYTQRHGALAYATRQDRPVLARSYNYLTVSAAAIFAAGQHLPAWHEVTGRHYHPERHEPEE